jgi:ATP-dependent RNA helicase HelY
VESTRREKGKANSPVPKTHPGGGSRHVAAPTGSGKTVVAEFGVWETFRGTGRVFYTTPIKALSNQKYRDLRDVYGDNVGLLTGDVSENRDARVLVMTTEILRNMLLQAPWEIDDVDCIIFDEIHYLADQERGTTWEESIILCPEHVQLICLSATVSNAEEIAQWIGRTHRPIRLITHDQRPVPLALYYFNDRTLHVVVDHTGNLVADFPNTGGEAKRRVNRAAGGRRREERTDPGADEPQPHEIIDALARDSLLPAIYFLFSRADCQTYAERLASTRANLADRAMQRQIKVVLDRYLAALRPEDRELEQVELIVRLARVGIGFHHAGLLPILKQLVETLFGAGLMQVVFATDTLALGVNMPARTVVIGRMSKWDGRRRRPLIPNEFQQMAGRAGRRGMDAFGHVVVPYSPWVAFREMLGVATGELEPVRSSFAVRYNTVLHLWDPPDGDRVRQMLRRSLAQFQTSQRIRQLEHDIIEVGGDIAAVPKGCLIGLDAGDELLEDYQRVVGLHETSRQYHRRLERQVKEIGRPATTTPWGDVNRQALRKLFRHARPGIVFFHRTREWGIFVARPEGMGGIGLAIFGDQLVHLTEYRDVVYVAEHHRVPVSEVLVVDALSGLQPPAADLLAVSTRLNTDELPDVAGMIDAHLRKQEELFEKELQRTRAELAEAASVTESLTDERDRHPCHHCERRREHRNYLTQIERLDRERTGLDEMLIRETEAEEQRVQSVIWGIKEVLHRFGYLRRGFATEKADMLAGVFDNDGLILCELIDRGMLDSLAPEDLGELFSWYSFDRDFRYGNHFTLSPELSRLRRRIEEIERAVTAEEREHGLFISMGHNPAFYGAAGAWCRGATMAEISEQIQLSEGDLVLTFNKTIDLVKQVREMLEDVKPEHELIGPLRRAERLLCRGIVEQSLNLGFAPLEEATAPETEPVEVE